MHVCNIIVIIVIIVILVIVIVIIAIIVITVIMVIMIIIIGLTRGGLGIKVHAKSRLGTRSVRAAERLGR